MSWLLLVMNNSSFEDKTTSFCSKEPLSERRTRIILFWKSLTGADTEIVFSEAKHLHPTKNSISRSKIKIFFLNLQTNFKTQYKRNSNKYNCNYHGKLG